MADGDDVATDTDATVKERVREYWDDRAEDFDDDAQHGIQSEAQRDRWLSVLREWAGDGPGRVLDAGCGTGFLSLLLSELGHEAVGVDVSPEMLRRARAKALARERDADGGDHSADFARGDAERLPLPDGAVELVVARHLLWTLPDPEAAIAEWQRVAGSGGRVLLIEGYWDFDEHPGEYREIHQDLPLVDGRPPGELAAVLTECGLEAVEYEPLDDPVLWGRDPEYEYYAMAGEVPGDDTG